MLKRLFCALAACLLLCCGALAENVTITHKAEPIELESMDQFPDCGDSLFLPKGSTPLFYRNFQDGHWMYLSSSERIEITRYTQVKPKMVYYIADIQLEQGTGLSVRSADPEHPSRNMLISDLAKREHVAYAQNSDYFSYRVKNKQTPGVIVRAGQVLQTKTQKRFLVRLPNLATIGLYPDGRAEVNEAFEKTGDEYIADGASDVLAFGPLLIRDGVIQDVDQGTFRNKEPRSCLGWIEPSHYVGLLVEGRKNHSNGATMLTCAQLLADQGCVGAINLDGGGSAAILFMGESIMLTNRGNPDNNQRWMPDIIVAGQY